MSGTGEVVRVDVRAFPIRRRAEVRLRLLELLAEKAGRPVELAEGPHGKPTLVQRPGLPDLRFSLTHSGALGAVAIAEGVEVGIDAEQVTERRPPDRLRDWTRHEAYVKGLGVGIARRPEAPLERGWKVLGLDLAPGYIAALAVCSESEVEVSLESAFPGGA